MNVLVACEESQRVCIAFRKKGHNAFSCDVLTCSGGHPEWHIQGDVLNYLNPEWNLIPGTFDSIVGIYFETMDKRLHFVKKWDLIIAHPPCTYLTVSANKLYNISKYGEKAVQRLKSRKLAVEFFMNFVNADCNMKVIENPIGVMSTLYRKPNQIVQPYFFGDPVRKSTCLWLFNVPPLVSTNIVDFECIHSNGASGGYSGFSWIVRDENGKILPYNHPLVSQMRSKTYPGIAEAMAEQWG